MLTINFTPFPILETERLLLRRLTNEDVDEVFALRSNPVLMQYIPRPLATSKEEVLAHIQLINDKIDANEGINWAIRLKESPKMIGIIGHYKLQIENQRSEIGYMLLGKYNNKGIVSEAINEVLKYGFDLLNLHSVESIIDPRNSASERVLQKNGFVKEAHFIENEFAMGKFWDGVVYSLLKRNFIR